MSKSNSPRQAATKPSAPLSETLIPKRKEGTAEECIEDLRQLAVENPEKAISRNWYRVNGGFAESVWSQHYGTFHEFKRQAGIVPTRQVHKLEKEVAKHASVDHYRRLSVGRLDYAENYLRDDGKRFKTMIAASDLHDVECDPFFLRVLTDTVQRVQPDVVSLVGDVFDLPEFGKYTVDPRNWGVVERIRSVHEEILAPIREAAPEAQFDLIEGNHEARLLKHLADASPAMRAVLSDLHGMTVGELLGLDKYEVNYVARSDLSAYTQRDHTKELAKNYRIYWDAVLCHHFPYARNMALPGINGHHHKHQVWPMFNPIYGAYEWHQLGSGHMRVAEYCEGEKWHMGFALIHVDTATKAVNIEYVPVTDMAIVGGRWYQRSPSEQTSAAKSLVLRYDS